MPDSCFMENPKYKGEKILIFYNTIYNDLAHNKIKDIRIKGIELFDKNEKDFTIKLSIKTSKIFFEFRLNTIYNRLMIIKHGSPKGNIFYKILKRYYKINYINLDKMTHEQIQNIL